MRVSQRVEHVSWLTCLAAFAAALPPAWAGPPTVVRAAPDDGDTDVDPGLDEIRIEFDSDMSSGGYSFCRGAESPKFVGKPRWRTRRVVFIAVRLEPNRSYAFSVNCPSLQSFRGSAGESATPYPIRFTTGDAGGGTTGGSLDEASNREAVESLRRAIDEHYSYLELRQVDWDAQFQRLESKLVAASTPEEFARAAARLLAPAKDVHIWLQAGGAPIA